MKRRGMIGLGAIPWATVPIQDAQAQRPPVAGAPAPPQGAFADGESHPLSSRFPNLQAARAVFPHAVAMTDEIDWCVLQGAINAVEARGSGALHVPNTGKAYVLNRGLVINPHRITVRGDGATLDFRRLPGNARGIWFKADGAPQYGHEKHFFEGFELVGPGGRDGSPCAMFFQTDTAPLSTRVQVRDCTIHGFGFGLLFGHRAYLISFDHVSVYACHFCVHAPYDLQDAGESVVFTACSFFNSRCAISNPASFGLKFNGCSLDYCQRMVWDNNGPIEFFGCHIEMNPPVEPPFHCNHGKLQFFGGMFLIHNPNRAPARQAELFAFNQAGASVHMFGLSGWNWHTTSGRLSNGPGRIYSYPGTEINTAPAGYAR